MGKELLKSRAYRQLAEEYVRRFGEIEDLPESALPDLATSLVRQWVTYDGRATFVTDVCLYHLRVRTTPLGKLFVKETQIPSNWPASLESDWHLNPDDFPDIFAQLNLGQSVEVTNGLGVPLRLWVNPQKSSVGVDELVKTEAPAGLQRDYLKIAHTQIEHLLITDYQGVRLDDDEVEQLAQSVARQWQQYAGHASLFLDGQRVAVFTLTEGKDGTCNVTAQRRKFDIAALLSKYGCPPDTIPVAIAQLNLGKRIESRDEQGVLLTTITHNPKEGRLHVEDFGRVAPRQDGPAPPIYCPHCSAVMGIWEPAQQHQSCPACKKKIARG